MKEIKKDIEKKSYTITETEEKKKLDRDNELSNKKKELKRNEQVLNGWTDEQGREYLSCDELIKKNKLFLEMKQIEMSKCSVEPANRRYLFEVDKRWQQIQKELVRMPEIEGLKKAIKRVEKQKEDIIKRNPELKKQIEELEKKDKASYIG